MLGGTRGSGDGSSSANPSKKKARSRSRSPANMPIGKLIVAGYVIRNFSIEFQSESDSLESSDSSLSCWCTTVPGRYVKGTNYFSKFCNRKYIA